MAKTWVFIYVTFVTLHIFGAEIEKTIFSDIEKRINNNSDTLYVVNFWATWCKPCVEELPIFNEVYNQYKNRKISFIFISLDFPSSQDKVGNFIRRNQVVGTHYLLNDTNSDTWIDRINPKWQGEIPATLFVNNATKKRRFHSGQMTKKKLSKFINSNISKK